MNINIDNMFIFYLGISILGLAIVLMALPTILRDKIEEAAKRLNAERSHTRKAAA